MNSGKFIFYYPSQKFVIYHLGKWQMNTLAQILKDIDESWEDDEA